MLGRAKVAEPLTYGWWARLLRLRSRPGADAWLHRLKRKANLRLEKLDKGIRAIITQQVKGALKGSHARIGSIIGDNKKTPNGLLFLTVPFTFPLTSDLEDSDVVAGMAIDNLDWSSAGGGI